MKDRRRFKRADDKKESKFNKYKVSKSTFEGFDWVIALLITPPIVYIILALYIVAKF
jgi:hypothetical protein